MVFVLFIKRDESLFKKNDTMYFICKKAYLFGILDVDIIIGQNWQNLTFEKKNQLCAKHYEMDGY